MLNKDVAKKYIAEYYKDAEALNVKKATVAPRATEHMDEIIELIKGLIEKGHAYPADNGDVYFAVRSYDSYGKLTGQSIESLESGARIDPGEHKRDPLDFGALEERQPGEPSWIRRGAKGRPGWHIECSAMSMSNTRRNVRHTRGGKRPYFHRTMRTRIAQSEGLHGQAFCSILDAQRPYKHRRPEMSKSLGNLETCAT